MTTTTTIEQPVTVEKLAKAFEAWNNGVRTSPQDYKTAEECAQMGVSQMSAEQADYFHSLLIAVE